ncbi:MAG: molybdenum cofactor guanylyltransferase [Actinomycetota bacterium]|nr:molybdenum cofactor guanylyltransferase [Actinomycetota bacterium]
MILAGGTSRRMGRDKLQMEVGGSSLLHRVYNALESRCEEILVVGEGGRSLGGPDFPKARHILDLRPGQAGPLAGIEAGLAAARRDRVFVAAGDMPFIPSELVAFLLELAGGENVRVAVPCYEGRLHPLCAAYRREVLTDLSFALNIGVRAMHAFLESIDGVRRVEGELNQFGEPRLFLTNVNSPEDLEKAQRACGVGEL